MESEEGYRSEGGALRLSPASGASLILPRLKIGSSLKSSKWFASSKRRVSLHRFKSVRSSDYRMLHGAHSVAMSKL